MATDKLKGRRAFITGSSRGIGQQIALGLASLGCDVIIHGRQKNHTAITRKLLESYPVKADEVHGDLSDNKNINTMISGIHERFGNINILYNNAAIMCPYEKDIWQHKPQAFENSFQVNVYTMYYLCAAFIPGMIDRNFGRVINLTSGIKDQTELLPYSITKAAVDKLTRDISFKLKGTGVMIYSLDPGWLKTDLGGPNAWYPVEDVLPGALFPALNDNDDLNGSFLSAIELKDIKV